MNATTKPKLTLAEWQGVAAILALREERRLRRIQLLKDMGAIPAEREVYRHMMAGTPLPQAPAIEAAFAAFPDIA